MDAKLPEAHIQHHTDRRVRLRIPSKRGNAAFFSDAKTKLAQLQPFDTIEVNPLTGSILLCHEAIDIDRLMDFAEEKEVFSINQVSRTAAPLAEKIAEPIADINRFIDRLSGGELDLPGVIFLSLLGFGLYEILRGNFKAPPWYTAFWYAFGVFSKSILDHSKRDAAEPHTTA
jgi:hypothetical protein